ncbi:hypothetical protein FS749_015126 [Ceratobasidium sp. UAMH 11750]|nr:hypothetical protein FS749_015126 [Ceratobasidium sp. UAMH 11750]
MSILQRYNKVILTVAAIVVVPSAVYGGVVLRDKFGTPTYHSTRAAATESKPTALTSTDNRSKIQGELKALLDEREEVQRKIDELKARIAKK